MACPPKYRQMNAFYKYYSGQLIAPVLTIFSRHSLLSSCLGYRVQDLGFRVYDLRSGTESPASV